MNSKAYESVLSKNSTMEITSNVDAEQDLGETLALVLLEAGSPPTKNEGRGFVGRRSRVAFVARNLSIFGESFCYFNGELSDIS